MTILTVLILAITALLLGFLFRGRGRGWAFLVVSVVAIYWLQPSTPIRNLDFWLPTATIVLVCLSWILTASGEPGIFKNNWKTLAVISGISLLISLTRLLAPTGILTPSQPPPAWQVLIAFTICAGLSLLLGILKAKPVALWLGFAFLLALLVILKLPWLNGQVSALLRALNGQSVSHASPLDIRWLGFSYVAFRLIHTIRDRQSGRLPKVTLQEYVIYMIFFPAFTAGPIDRIERFITNLREPPALNATRFAEGAKRVVTGLFKKFILADSLAIIALNGTNALQVRQAGWMWLLLYAFTFQIYFDFSGYTDIAIGMGAWLGIDLPENFDHPYRQTNLTHFWNKWHMSLTQWFRAYYFNPLTRRLRSSKRAIPPVLVLLVTQVSTMVLIGLWHGITWNFVIWGLWHGIGLFLQNRWTAWVQPFQMRLEKVPLLKMGIKLFGVFLTFNYVALGWIWFALPNLQTSLTVFAKLLGR